MALERLPIDDALAGYLDATLPVPAHIASRYEEHAGHPSAVMMTHPDLGRLLATLTLSAGGRAALEIGTFVGISAAWIAEGLRADGRLDALEIDEEQSRETSAWLEGVGLAERVRIHPGPAHETLATLPAGTYDLCYIDADKPGYPAYLEHAIRLVRPGGFVVADNAFGGGDVSDAGNDEPRVVGLRAYTSAAIASPRLLTTILPIDDGVVLSVRRGPGG